MSTKNTVFPSNRSNPGAIPRAVTSGGYPHGSRTVTFPDNPNPSPNQTNRLRP